MKIRNPLRRRWIAVLVGMESGQETPLDFVWFWTEQGARAWADRLNAQHPGDGLIRYDVRKVP